MDNTRFRRPNSPALMPPPSPTALLRSKSRSSASITAPENNSCAANTSQRSTAHRSKSVTKSRANNKDEENLNPMNCKTKPGFPKFLKSSPAASPSAWALSPGRSLGSPLLPPPKTVEPAVVYGGRGKLGGRRGSAVNGVLRFFRSKKAGGTVEAAELHRFRILQNRLLQWRYVNVKAERSMANVKTIAQDRIFSVRLQNMRMRNGILEKRIEVEKLRKEIKLYRIIIPQVTLLKQWAKLDKRNQESVGCLASVLSNLSLRLPLLHGAKSDIKGLEQALSMAMEVMTKLEAMITKRKSEELEKTLYMLTERLSIFKEQEDCLEKLEDAVCSVTTLLAEENSIRIQLIQATNSTRKDDPTC
ncbi:QWRF motif-containing protein 7 [Cucurbita maxima]|uniref:QWRF motif-containing protein 7 n=1 Tax=Cucurbita maxima TaxID=3661 RepID=A0A6J1I736_CUCMA|nr:QWRF motif-containing protein 7 [Cucurbita maxima]